MRRCPDCTNRTARKTGPCDRCLQAIAADAPRRELSEAAMEAIMRTGIHD